jgi:hypothetical protein
VNGPSVRGDVRTLRPIGPGAERAGSCYLGPGGGVIRAIRLALSNRIVGRRCGFTWDALWARGK